MPTIFKPLPEISEKDIKRFKDKIEVKSGGCWQWVGGELSGYPRFDWSDGRTNKRSLLGHRLSYFIHYNEDPQKIIVQTCGNRMCVNPDHLEARAELTNKQTLNKGDEMGTFIFLERVPAHPDRPTAKFLCECGKEFISRIDAVKSGRTKSCGCKTKEFISRASTKYTKAIEFTELGVRKMPEFNEYDYRRFWEKVNLQARIDVCWNWQAGNNGRYGYFAIGKTSFKTNRVAYYLFNKVDPEESHVLHTCDNPKCCNPHHLFLGTQEDNMRDMIEKGRGRGGVNINTAKLNEDQVRELRRLYKEGVKKNELAVKFGISETSAYAVANYNSYKFIK